MDRQAGIINLLLDSMEPITVNTIARNIKVSNKTVRNDLQKIEEYIKSSGLVLSKKPGVGVCIEGPEEKKAALISRVKSSHETEPYSPEDRKDYILRRLFISEKNVTLSELAEELYVSRVTIHNDLKEVEKWLTQYNLKLMKKPNYGIEITGDEENWRNAAATLIVANKGSKELKKMLCGNYPGRIDYKTILKLKELVNIDYAVLEKIVTSAESKLKFSFSDEAYISLIIHIAISISRLKHHKDIHLSNEVLDVLKGNKEFIIAQGISSDIEKAFNVKLPESEVGYILLHIIGAKMQQNKVDGYANLNLASEEESDMSTIMSKEIISIAGKVLSVDLRQDKQLLNGLILHLRPTINRLKYGLTLRNPILNEIKENYPEIYGAAWMTSVVFQKHLGVKTSEEEIGYIALHLGAAVERQKRPLRTLVVCTSGIGTSQLLAAKLERHFRQIEIEDIVSIVSLNERQLEDIDIIISTVPFESSKPVLTVSPILAENDLKMVDLFINDQYKKINSNMKKYTRDSFFDNELYVLRANWGSRRDVLREMYLRLYSKGYVRKEYIDDLYNREKTGSTAIGKGAAIPHGSPKFVNQTKLMIATLDKPVQWGGEPVDIIIMICISQHDINSARFVMRSLYNGIESDEFLESLRGCRDNGDVGRVLDNFYGGLCDADK